MVAHDRDVVQAGCQRERPIIFSGPMVRAILAGTKTQTRRLVREPRWAEPGTLSDETAGSALTAVARVSGCLADVACPYGVPGDRLWVREIGWEPKTPTARDLREGADTWPRYAYDADGISEQEAEDFKRWGWKRRPSIHMPRWASRLTLEVTEVRVQRLQEISEEDAKAEGVTAYDIAPARFGFEQLWDSINGSKAPWSSNPFVWAVSFKRVARMEAR